MARLHTSLFWKLMLAFILVVIVAVGGAALVARQTTTSEFQRLRQTQGGAGNSDQVERYAAYYAENGGWQGVSTLVPGGRGQGRGQGQDGRGGPPLRLADAEGKVVLNTVDGQVGQRLSDEELAQGEPVVVDGQQVGTLLLGSYQNVPLTQAEQDFLDRVRRALFVSALAALGVALILGFLLFRGITAPLRRLTEATTAVATGDLSVRVSVKSQDEVGRLGQAFNRMASDLAQADQLRRSMTADIAHELRTPLTVIQGNLEAILDGVYPADAEHLEPVLSKTQLLNRLVEDLRTLALADAGELALHLSPIDLGGLVQRTVRGFVARAESAGVALICQDPGPLPPVRADAVRVEQVLGILLDNALRHTPAGGQIVLGLQEVDEEIRVRVSDTGQGVPSEALPHLFERFYRVEEDASRPAGSGLGLAIAKAIVSAHGGRTWAESEPRQGTAVSFALPTVGG